LISSLLIFLSCQTDDQITGYYGYNDDTDPIEPRDGNGDFHEIKDIYFDFNSGENYNIEFWKFDLLDFQATNLEFSHCGPECNGEQDIFTLSTFHNSYYIPPESFNPNASSEDCNAAVSSSECANLPGCEWSDEGCVLSIVYIYDPDSEEYIPFNGPVEGFDDPGFLQLSDLLNEEPQDSSYEKNSEDFILSTPNLSPTDPISAMSWSSSEGLYAISTISPTRDTIDYFYEYDYQIKHSFVPLDTIKNPRIPDHMYLIDPEEYSDSIRTYVLYDSLSVPSASSICNQTDDDNACNQIEICSWVEGECLAYTPPITIDREYDFYGYINEINDDFGFRKTQIVMIIISKTQLS